MSEAGFEATDRCFALDRDSAIEALQNDDSELPQPLGYRVLVRPDVDEQYDVHTDQTYATTSSGLAVPTAAVRRERASQVYGRVVAVGPLAYSRDGGAEKWGVKVGAHVMYVKHAGALVEHDGITYILLNDEDLLCQVPNNYEAPAVKERKIKGTLPKVVPTLDAGLKA